MPNDSVTISAPAGSGNLAGTVSFALYASGDCARAGDLQHHGSGGGASPQTVSTTNTTAQLASGTFSWSVSYDSTQPRAAGHPGELPRKSSLTITNGGTVQPLARARATRK